MIKKGEVYYIQKSPSAAAVGAEIYAARPGIIVSNDEINAAGRVVLVVYLTTSPTTDANTHVTIRSLRRNSVALCEQISNVSVNRVGDRMGELSAHELMLVEQSCALALGINESLPDDETEDAAPDLCACDGCDSLTRAEAERDTYKGLFESLMSRFVKGAQAE